MRKLAAGWRSFFDVRPGEYGRTIFMGLYLLFVLFAYYILKSASESMFLNKVDIDKLPRLYIYMAVFGGTLAYLYSKLAAKTSLRAAVFWTMLASVVCLVGMWFPLRTRNVVVVWAFAVWVRLFSVVTVTQGWLVASNLFNSREAKRLYGLLGMGMILGAWWGGEFTNLMVRKVGTNNLLFASAALVVLAYGAFLLAASQEGVTLARAKGAEAEEGEFSLRDIGTDIGRSRHLQALIAIMTMQFIVDTLIDFQFKSMAKAAFKGDELTAFLGRFQGRYLNLTEVVLQFFFTKAVVRRLGVGGTLQIMPVSLSVASMFTFAAPSVITASVARLVEASTRYTLVRTGNELFYLPLPKELRNRIKAFIDIFVDRAARGLAGVMLIVLAKPWIGVRGVALFTIVVTIPWIFLTIRAQREYVRTIRRRLEARRLDPEEARVTMEDADMIRLLETAAYGSSARQAAYALSLLGDVPGYELKPLLEKLSGSPLEEVRAQVYALARSRGMTGFVERAQEEIRPGAPAAVVRAAVAYLLTVSGERAKLAREFLEHPDSSVQEGLIEALAAEPGAGAEVVTHEWISRTGRETDWRRRALAARMVGACGDQGTEAIHWLLADSDPRVAAAACQAAGALRNRAYIPGVVRLLANPRVRGAATEGLAQYGPLVCGTLGDMLDDEKLPVKVRSAIPKVLRLMPHQRGVDALLAAQRRPEPVIRSAALKALSRLRETAPGLSVSEPFLTQHVLNEAHHYFELSAQVAALRTYRDRPHSAVSLLARTLEERLRQSLERVFRLLGLRFPASEMYQTYLAIAGHDKEKHATAVELLDNVLDQDLKRVLLPMLETPERLLEHGRELFGVEVLDAESTIRALLGSEDAWVVACAMAAAAELELRGLAGDIAQAARHAGAEVCAVAHAAQAGLI